MEVIQPLIDFLCSSRGCGDRCTKLSDLVGWSWPVGSSPRIDWSLSMKQWREIAVEREPIMVALHCCWSTIEHRIAWTSLWKSLWMGWGLPGARLIAWRILHHSYFTNARGARWNVTQDICLVCNLPRESIQHLFFECKAVSCRWRDVATVVRHSPLQSLAHETLFLTLQKAF